MRGIPQIEVTFSIDANGIVNVSAKDLGTGKHQEITLTQSSNMSSDEIDRAVKDAQRYAEEDSLRKQRAELQNRAEELLYQTKAAQKKLNAVDKERIEGMRKRVKQAMDAGNDRELKRACEDLTEALNACGRYVDPTEADDQDGAMDADIQK
jgi:molecular chaperone DnaK